MFAFSRIALTFAAALTGIVCAAVPALAQGEDVARATLHNGLRIVVVRDALAPVVTTMLNYEAGSDDQTIAGQAHAVEHMMFRGSRTLSSSQLMDTIDITGGSFDADTQNEVTQYYFTVPSQYLDIALRLERSRATSLMLSQDQWNQERGAITQEVTQDQSNAFYRLFEKTQHALLAGTPYDKNGLGTVRDFAHGINHSQLAQFYQSWYHPNNAIYVIVGDVDPQQTIARVRTLFGDIPSTALPSREAVHFRPVRAQLFHDTSDQPFTVVLKGFRLPGFESKDFAATQILSDVFNSQRSDIAGLVFAGKALGAQFQLQSFPKASLGALFYLVPVTTKPEAADTTLRDVLSGYAKDGVPAELVDAAKRREVAQLEYNATSIEGLAFEWSQAVAVQHIGSPQSEISALQNVTAADVNRVLRASLAPSSTITGYIVPKNLGKVSAGSSGLAKENNAIPPSKHQPLPAWAQSVLARLAVPAQATHPFSTTLPNGMKLIVAPEHSTHVVTVSGEILNDPKVQEPSGKEGVSDVTSGLFGYGTTSMDRIAFQRALDAIAANETAGTTFGVQSLASDFDRAVALLADNELRPRFEPQAFAIVKNQTLGSLAGSLTSPDHLASVALNTSLYPAGDPMQRFATTQSVGTLTLDDVRAWYAGAYRPDLASIVVVGDITPERAQATIAKYFGSWTAQGAKPNVYPSPIPANGPGAANVPATGRVQSSVQLAETLGITRSDPDYARLRVANTILTGGFYSSLLYHDLREVHGYVYLVGSRVEAGKVRSTFSVEYASNPENVLPAQRLIVADLQRMQNGTVEADRLLRAKAQLMGDVPIAEDSYDQLAQQLLGYSVHDLPLDQNTIDAQNELGTTAEQLQAAMRKWIRPGAFVRVVTGPAPR